MGCDFISTKPKPGDDYLTLLRKLVQALGETWTCQDNEWTLVAKILQHFGGAPKPGDTIPKLWEKIRLALGDVLCHCGDTEWHSIRRAIDQLLISSFAVGDSKYNLVYDFLARVSNGDHIILDPPVISQSDTNELSISGLSFGSGGITLIVEHSADGVSGWTQLGGEIPITGDPMVIDITGITNAFFRARIHAENGNFSPYSVVFEAYRSPTATGNFPNDSMESYTSGVDLAGLNGGENGINLFNIPWVSDYVVSPYGATGPVLAPNNLSNLELWVKSDQITGLNNGDLLGQWVDQSGNGRDFLAVLAQRPTYNTNVQNGLPGVNLTSTSGVGMIGAYARAAGDFSVMAVYRANNLTNVAGRRVVQGSNNWLIGPYSGFHRVFNGAFLQGYYISTAPLVVVVTQLGNVFRGYINGVLFGLRNAAPTYPGTINLGAIGAFNEPADVRLFETAVYSRALTEAEVYGLSQSMVAKWGL